MFSNPRRNAIALLAFCSLIAMIAGLTTNRPALALPGLAVFWLSVVAYGVAE